MTAQMANLQYPCREMLSPVGAKDFELRLSPRRGWFSHQCEPRAGARGYVLAPLRGDVNTNGGLLSARL